MSERSASQTRVETPSRDLLRRLTLAPGAPGAEDAVRIIVRDALRDVGPISYDRLGSILCEKKGSSASPRVVLDAHLDEVAFLVQSISDEGKLGLVPLGGWWGHVLLAQRMDIIIAGGKVVPGVVGSKPPHFLKPEEQARVIEPGAMYIDIGAASRKEVEALGVRIGDPIVPHAEFIELAAPDVLSSKAFDDRVGVGLLGEALQAPPPSFGIAADDRRFDQHPFPPARRAQRAGNRRLLVRGRLGGRGHGIVGWSFRVAASEGGTELIAGRHPRGRLRPGGRQLSER